MHSLTGILALATRIARSMSYLFKTCPATLFACLFFSCLPCGVAQAPASQGAPSPPSSSMPQPDYRSLLDEAVNGGFEAFEAKQPATADEYREYVHLLGQVVEMRALLEERITNSQILTSETAKIQQ
ncbi:MAG: hypothetical protein ACOVLK_01215, partial [Terrimicrobiaceae bacterium]